MADVHIFIVKINTEGNTRHPFLAGVVSYRKELAKNEVNAIAFYVCFLLITFESTGQFQLNLTEGKRL